MVEVVREGGAHRTGAADDPLSVEAKPDGARMQVHRRGDEVRILTRILNESPTGSPR